MSLPTRRQAYAFLGPLKGRSTILLVTSRKSHMALSRFILACLAASRLRVAMLDTSCFHGVNIRNLTGSLPKEFMQQSTIFQWSGQEEEDSLADMTTTDAPVVLIDDLNAILHLLSSQGGQRSGMHRLATFYHVLSYNARVNQLLVLGIAYNTDWTGLPGRVTKRSLPKISDLQISTEVKSNEILFRCDEIRSWPGGDFRFPLYFDERT